MLFSAILDKTGLRVGMGRVCSTTKRSGIFGFHIQASSRPIPTELYFYGARTDVFWTAQLTG
jgi:hypothetical protein